MKGILRIYLDGRRETDLTLPDNWHTLTEEAQRRMLQPEMDELLSNSMSWEVETDEEV